MNIAKIIEQEKVKKIEPSTISKTISKEDTLEEKLFVSEDKRLQIIKKIHDQSAIEHSRIRRTLKMIERFFY
jgi:hypothetical protein